MYVDEDYLDLIGFGEIKEEDLKSIACLQYRDKRVWLNVNQEFVLSKSGKTIYIVQYQDSKNKIVLGKKGFRVASCLFYNEIAN